MSWYHPSTLLDKIFEGGIILKGISGAAEFLCGLLLFFVSPATIHNIVVAITQQEVIENPHDTISHLLLGWTDHIGQGSIVFLIVYLWVHAAVKLVAVIGLLRNQRWAYPFSLISLGALMLYQIYDIFLKGSIGMVLLTIFDIFILWLIWREYGKERIKWANADNKNNVALDDAS